MPYNQFSIILNGHILFLSSQPSTAHYPLSTSSVECDLLSCGESRFQLATDIREVIVDVRRIGDDRPVIANATDIDDYLSYVRGKLEAALAAGKKIAFN